MIEIRELMMTLPDMTPEQGERLGQDVAERLLDILPTNYAGANIESLDISLSITSESDHSQLVNDITTQIHYQLMNR
jgi:hypothetical protein